MLPFLGSVLHISRVYPQKGRTSKVQVKVLGLRVAYQGSRSESRSLNPEPQDPKL